MKYFKINPLVFLNTCLLNVWWNDASFCQEGTEIMPIIENRLLKLVVKSMEAFLSAKKLNDLFTV